MLASQDFRDGAAWGAWQLYERARTISSYGADPTELLGTLAGAIRREMGGAQPWEDEPEPTEYSLSELVTEVAKNGPAEFERYIEDVLYKVAVTRADPQYPASDTRSGVYISGPQGPAVRS